MPSISQRFSHLLCIVTYQTGRQVRFCVCVCVLCRQIDIVRDDVLALEGISQQVIARKFLELWTTRGPEGDDPESREIWLRARELGLRKIKSVLEARR